MSRGEAHQFSKPSVASVTLVAGLGVEGDCHAGTTVQHLSRMRRDPTAPNLRQVHLLHAELLDEIGGQGHLVHPGQLGENVTTRGVDLLALPAGTRLNLGARAVLEVTGLRNPCFQIDRFDQGLLSWVLRRDGSGDVVRRAGVMAVVVHGGRVAAGDPIAVVLPAPPHLALQPV
ncbi:MAG: MOSC domain-containing protein [Nocardioidaceae bacterium]